MNQNALHNKVAVITGASSGIGKAITVELARQGATVVVLGRDKNSLSKVLSQVRQASPDSMAFQVDLADNEQLEVFSENLSKAIDAIDILIHCAGAFSLGYMGEADTKELDRLYKINVRAPYRLTQAMLPLIIERKGQVVFINSTAGLTARKAIGQYSATKFALKAIADSLREEVNREGVRVISVYPGRTNTPMQEKVFQLEGKMHVPEDMLQPESIAKVVLNALTLPRTAEVIDLVIRPMTKVG
jgi:NADP-dependent 3-hydroxy acid dehydrogenase YdfG